MPKLNAITAFYRALQDDICQGLERLDGKGQFREDAWTRPGGGGGRTRIITDGQFIEKGGVNYSHVFGELPAVISQKLKLPDGIRFDASGVSIVLHASHPFIPIIHMNIRYFEMADGTWWFGGGIDVTPIYVNAHEAKAFHGHMQALCDRFDATFYPRFSKWCDDYFYLKHRKETRGIGGLFFDRLTGDSPEKKSHLWQFQQAVGEAFLPAYTALFEANSGKPFGKREKQWQLLRRSRYVEFNLLYDKGTKFGLDTDGRTESILMSMPPLARWEYDYQAKPGSPEAETLAYLQA